MCITSPGGGGGGGYCQKKKNMLFAEASEPGTFLNWTFPGYNTNDITLFQVNLSATDWER